MEKNVKCGHFRSNARGNAKLKINFFCLILYLEERGRKIAYISADFGYKKSDGNGNVILKGRKTDIFDIIITDIGSHRS